MLAEIKDKDKEQKESEDIIFGDDLGLFYSGLFNFYQFAAFEVKRTFLKLISETVLKLKKELVLSLPGFMLCMLPPWAGMLPFCLRLFGAMVPAG